MVLLVGAELVRRRARWPPEFTRKLVHVGAGMWVFGALALFDHWWAACIATTAFVGINWLSARRSLIPAMDAARAEGLGTVWFMVSFTVLLGWFGSAGRPHLAAAAMMAMTWGDAAAALVGRRWGRHRYVIGGQTRSLEGSAAMAGATGISVALVLGGLAPGLYSGGAALVTAGLAGIAAALLEPAAPRGQDNLSVPIGVGVLLWLLETGHVTAGALAAGLALSLAVGLVAYAAGSLTAGGVLGAILTGGTTLACGGLAWGLLLIVFFVSSSALSRVGTQTRRKREAARAFAKGGQRDLGQVLANGGVPAVLAVLSAAAPASWQPALYTAFAASLAAVTADTWATELGVLSRAAPRLVTSGRVVAAGTSGGVSALGLLAAAGGALFIGGAAVLLAGIWPVRGVPAGSVGLIGSVFAGGLLGALGDSVLGATIQQVYWCPACQTETERRIHDCGLPTLPRRGRAWADNEVVNLGCALAGALVGLLLGGR
ncbi:MAG TPA: DUF92 domain-containing protein [Chloroflexia bacterium]|nr:DUF92 domain-containing protein [Chloroflexia bacterium]